MCRCRPWRLAVGATDGEDALAASAAANMGTAISVVKALMAVPAPQLKEIRTALFEYVEFSNAARGNTAEAGRVRRTWRSTGAGFRPAWTSGRCLLPPFA